MTSTERPDVLRPYRPANGTDGMDFMDSFCDRCVRDRAFQKWYAGEGPEADSCPILAATCIYNVDDPQYPKEWIEDEYGPRCTAFEPCDE